MINDWPVIKLGEVCDFYNGTAHEDCVNSNGKYTIVNSKFIASDGKEYKKTDENRFPLKNNDIVMVMSDVPNGKALAKCFIIDEDNQYTLNQRICVLRSNKFDVNFLYYQLNRHNYLLSFDNGNRQTNLRKDDILKCPLLVPPIDEQKRIANKIEKLFEEINKAIEKTEEAITQNSKLIIGELKKAFGGKSLNGWGTIRFGDYCDFNGGRQPPKSTFQYKEQAGFVRLFQIRDFGEKEQPVYVSKKNNLTYVEADDILIARYGASVGRILTGKKGAINVAIIKTIPKLDLSKKFLFWFLNNPEFQKYITSIPGRMAQAGFDKSVLVDLNIPIPFQNNKPDLREQNIYADRLDKLKEKNDQLRNKYTEQIKQLEVLKQSILNQAFQGKL